MGFSSGGGSSSISSGTDVALSNPSDGQVLTYDGTTGKWKNVAVSGSSAVTLAALPAGSNFTRDYVSSAYPVRGSSRTDIICIWRGPTPPTIGGNYAVDNVDEWKVTP